MVGYFIPNPLYTYLLIIYDLARVGFYGISTIVGYLVPNPLYTNICLACKHILYVHTIM